MTSASSSSAKNLFVESKKRLAERVVSNVNNAGSVARQIVRGSRVNEILSQTIQNFASHETVIENSHQNLRKIELVRAHIGIQHDSIQQSAEKLPYIHEQLYSLDNQQ